MKVRERRADDDYCTIIIGDGRQPISLLRMRRRAGFGAQHAARCLRASRVGRLSALAHHADMIMRISILLSRYEE